RWSSLKTWAPRGRSSRHDSVPPDHGSPVWFGILVHLGGPLLSIPLLAVLGMTPGVTAAVMFTLGVVTTGIGLLAARLQPAAQLPALQRRDLLRHFLWDILAKGFGVGGVVLVLGCGLGMMVSPHETLTTHPGHMLAALLFCDFWYYSVHRWLMHGRGQERLIRLLRREHNVHHSVTALDFFRGNQGSLIDNGVVSFPLPLIVISTLLGMSPAAIVWVYMVLMMVQVTHHLNHTFRIGALRYLIFDSHAHKMHHCKKGQLVNFAAVFAIWDRLLGSYYEDESLNPTFMHTNGIPLPISAQRKR
ncbi:MAG: sterol desaturase/sphingolipid hydroxylase (fatty acid hydroxylase superfamily), partial [Myxococcota bacterium]